jgi:hypothetical protein
MGRALVLVLLIGCAEVSGLADYQIGGAPGGGSGGVGGTGGMSTAKGGSGGAGGEGLRVCDERAGGFSDTFDVIDDARWRDDSFGTGSVGIFGGRLGLSVPDDTVVERGAELESVDPLDAEACTWVVRLDAGSLGETLIERLYFAMWLPNEDLDDDVAGFVVTNGALSPGYIENDVPFPAGGPFPVNGPLWLGIRHEGDDFYYSMSDDGVAWQLIAQQEVPFGDEPLTLLLGASVDGTMPGGGEALFDDLNLPP